VTDSIVDPMLIALGMSSELSRLALTGPWPVLKRGVALALSEHTRNPTAGYTVGEWLNVNGYESAGRARPATQEQLPSLSFTTYVKPWHGCADGPTTQRPAQQPTDPRPSSSERDGPPLPNQRELPCRLSAGPTSTMTSPR
jgi:hypothetical protein